MAGPIEMYLQGIQKAGHNGTISIKFIIQTERVRQDCKIIQLLCIKNLKSGKNKTNKLDNKQLNNVYTASVLDYFQRKQGCYVVEWWNV